MNPAPGKQPPVPIRPLGMVEILVGGVGLITRNPWPFLGSALIFFVATELTSWSWDWLVGVAKKADEIEIEGVRLLEPDLTAFLLRAGLALVSYGLVGALQAVLVVHGMTGERMTIRAALRALGRRVRAVLGVTAALLFLPLMLFVPVALLIIAVTVGNLRGEDPSTTASLGLFAIPPAMAWALLVWLLLILFLMFAPMVAALEPVGAGRSVRRSAALVVKGFGRLLGVLLLMFVFSLIVAVIVGIPLTLISAGLALVAVDSDSAIVGGTAQVLATALEWLMIAFQAIGEAWVIVVLSLLYLDLRMRHEDLAGELWRRWTERQEPTA